MSTINLNQFKLAQEVGAVDLTFFGGENIVSCLYDPTETSTITLVPGEAVSLVDLGANDIPGVPIIGKRTLNSAAIFGTVVRQTKLATYYPSDKIEIAINGCPMWFKSAGALNRGVEVSAVVATPGNVQAVGTLAKLGVTLDKIASGGLGRVLINSDGVTAGTST